MLILDFSFHTFHCLPTCFSSLCNTLCNCALISALLLHYYYDVTWSFKGINDFQSSASTPSLPLAGELVEELIWLLCTTKQMSRPALHLLLLPQLRGLSLDKCPNLVNSSLCFHIAARCEVCILYMSDVILCCLRLSVVSEETEVELKSIL